MPRETNLFRTVFLFVAPRQKRALLYIFLMFRRPPAKTFRGYSQRFIQVRIGGRSLGESGEFTSPERVWVPNPGKEPRAKSQMIESLHSTHLIFALGHSAVELIEKNRPAAQVRHRTNLFDPVFSSASRIQSVLAFSVVGARSTP